MVNDVGSEKFEFIVEEDENGDIVLPLSEEVLEKLGWFEGDELSIALKGDSGTITNLSLIERQKPT